MGKKAIHISNLGKTYILDEKFKQNFREKIVSNSNQVQIVQALKNINLSIEKGEVVGILGDNGSGKSTLLKLISGITRPSLGTIEIHGKVASILEVGTGFNPELSGRENIYFSGEVLGMKRKELKNLEAKIIAFSEIKDFIDMQVKYYSSGMFMRLAFSVVAHVDADIILLDEVFSVGDASFRRKSEARIKEMANSEKTVIVVSHDLSSLSKLCSRFVWLENGVIKANETEHGVLNSYLVNDFLEEEETKAEDQKDQKNEEQSFKLQKENQATFKSKKLHQNGYISLTKIEQELCSELGRELTLGIKTDTNAKNILPSNNILISMSYSKLDDSKIHPVILLSYQMNAFSVTCNSLYNNGNEKQIVQMEPGEHSCSCIIPAEFLNNGVFGVSVYFLDEKRTEKLYLPNIGIFEVSFDPDFETKYIDNGQVTCPVKPRLKWEFS